MITPTCEHCANILGCPMLSDAKGTFVPERIITSENYRECPDWEPVTDQQQMVRTTLKGIQGEGALRVLHQMASVVIKKPAIEEDGEEESTDEMSVDMPDFGGMLREGMLSNEREEQLRYETEEDGSVILEDLGQGESIKRPRPTYQLRKFACDPEGYVQLDHSAGMFWTQDQLIRHILKIEVDQGFVTKSKKTKAAKGAATTEKTEKKDMATGRKVLTKRTKAGGGKGPKVGGAKTSRVGKPPAKKAAKPKDDEPQGLPEVPAGGIDLEAFAEDLQVKLGETIAAVVEEKTAALTAEVAELRQQASDLMDGITIFHDLLIQTGGTMQFENDEGETESLPEMFDNDNKILGHLDEGGDDPSE